MLNKLNSTFDDTNIANTNKEKTRFAIPKIAAVMTLFLSLSLISIISLADPYEPSKNEVIANWDTSTYSKKKTLEQVSEHLQKAQFPGQANIQHSMALSILLQLAKEQEKNPQYWYLLARSLQHQHEFDRAIIALDKALTIEVNFPSAWLLKANILMTKTDFKEAQKACTQLIGNTSLIMVATCSLEVASYEGELLQSYNQLSTIIQRSHTDGYSTDEQLFRIQVIADMALRLGQKNNAKQWVEKALKNRALNDMPLSFITLWADIQRELGAHDEIRKELNIILEHDGFKDDALLVRIAMAEKATNTNSSWQEQVERRVQLRLQRKDYYHAADIARYFLYVKPSPEKALLWAQINYQQAQLFNDEKLLKEAEKINNINVQEGEKNVYG